MKSLFFVFCNAVSVKPLKLHSPVAVILYPAAMMKLTVCLELPERITHTNYDFRLNVKRMMSGGYLR